MKHALVIGASGAIGFSTVSLLLDEGYAVTAHYFSNDSRLKTIESEVLTLLRCDLTDPDQVDQAFRSLPPVDVMVHAGGTAYAGLFEETSDETMDQLWHVHVREPLRIVRGCLPAMRRQGGGSIIFVTSVWGETGASYEVMYSTVKGAQIAFIKALGKELAPSGIRVNAVSPGAVDTTMLDVYSDEEKRALADDIPAGRLADPAEIAEAVLFLAGSRSSYITSHVLSVNGGWHA